MRVADEKLIIDNWGLNIIMPPSDNLCPQGTSSKLADTLVSSLPHLLLLRRGAALFLNYCTQSVFLQEMHSCQC